MTKKEEENKNKQDRVGDTEGSKRDANSNLNGKSDKDKPKFKKSDFAKKF